MNCMTVKCNNQITFFPFFDQIKMYYNEPPPRLSPKSLYSTMHSITQIEYCVVRSHYCVSCSLWVWQLLSGLLRRSSEPLVALYHKTSSYRELTRCVVLVPLKTEVTSTTKSRSVLSEVSLCLCMQTCFWIYVYCMCLCLCLQMWQNGIYFIYIFKSRGCEQMAWPAFAWGNYGPPYGACPSLGLQSPHHLHQGPLGSNWPTSILHPPSLHLRPQPRYV